MDKSTRSFTNETARTYTFGGYTLDTGRRQLVDRDGRVVALAGKAYELLAHLVRRPGQLIEKQALLETLWPNVVVEENNLNQAVSALRVALRDDARDPKFLATIKGRGYQFVAEVQALEGPYPASGAGSRRAFLAAAGFAGALILFVFLASRDFGGSRATAPILERVGSAALRLITDFPGSHSQPTLSPDGTMIAFVSTASGTPQIWVQNLQRGDPIQITHDARPAGSPAWAPDNSQIIYSRRDPDGTKLYSVGVLGTPAPRQVTERGTNPSFARGVNDIVFAVGQRIFVVPETGGDPRQIEGLPTSHGFARPEPALSRDGGLIAFVHADEGPLGNVWVVPVDGGPAQQLTTQDNGGGMASSPTFSPDGEYVVYSANRAGGQGQLWRVPVAGGLPEQLTVGSGEYSQPAISTDGLRLAFVAKHARWRIVRLDPTTGSRETVVEMRTPIILPDVSDDGERIVFFTEIGAKRQIFTVATDGSNLARQTFEEAVDHTLPIWHDDKILYYRDRQLVRLDPESGTDELVLSDFHWATKNWIGARGERLFYQEIDRPSQTQRGIVRDFRESDEIELPVPLEAGQWASDGQRLLGFVRSLRYQITICRPDENVCDPILVDGEPVRGAEPEWSSDESAVFYRRPLDNGECCGLWRTSVDGSASAFVGELTGFRPNYSYFDVGEDDAIYYNFAHNDSEEIWLAILEANE